MTTSAKGKELEDKANKKGAKAVEDAKSADDTKGAANVPENKLNNLKDNSVPASEMTAMRKGSKLGPSDEDMEASKAEDAKQAADQDMSIAARLTRTGYVLNENQITGERWVGLSIQRDPDADASAKAKTRVTSIAELRPFKGLTVKPINGEPFAVGEEFDKDSTPADWFAVLGGDGKPFLKDV